MLFRSVFSQDATSASVSGRSIGFAEKMLELVGENGAITGDMSSLSTGDAAAASVIIEVRSEERRVGKEC